MVSEGPDARFQSDSSHGRQLFLRPTRLDGLDQVLLMERHQDNALYVRQWSLSQHQYRILARSSKLGIDIDDESLRTMEAITE